MEALYLYKIEKQTIKFGIFLIRASMAVSPFGARRG
jgi:hypothetical protein